MRHGAVAVELDLVQPASFVFRRRAGQAPAWRAAARCGSAHRPVTAPGTAPGFRRVGFAAGFGFSTSSSIRRPDFTLSGRAARMSIFSSAARSRSLNSSQFFLLSSSGLRFQPRQHPAAVQLFAGQPELEGARLQALLDVVHRRPHAGVPDDHRPAAIFALGDDALEVDIFERMVLGLDRQPLVGRVERRALRHGPALQHAADLQPQIVVVGRRVMLVHDEAVACRLDGAAGRLRRLGKVPLGSVGLQFGHGATLESPGRVDNASGQTARTNEHVIGLRDQSESRSSPENWGSTFIRIGDRDETPNSRTNEGCGRGG